MDEGEARRVSPVYDHRAVREAHRKEVVVIGFEGVVDGGDEQEDHADGDARQGHRGEDLARQELQFRLHLYSGEVAQRHHMEVPRIENP